MGGALDRIVELDTPDQELACRRSACDEILARMRDESALPGATLADGPRVVAA